MCLAAGGFVLGETVVLLSLTPGLMIPALFFAAGLISLCCYGFLHGRRSKGAVGLSVFLLFVLAGTARAGYTKKNWEMRERCCEEIAGLYVEVRGQIQAIEAAEGSVELTLVKNDVRPGGNRQSGESPWSRRIPRILASCRTAEGGRDSLWQEEIKIGMSVAVKGELELFRRARNPGEFDFQKYYRASGIDCRMYGEEVRIIGEGFSPFPEFLRKLREKGKQNIGRAAQAEDAGIFSAAVLGDKKGLDREIKDLYQKNGIAHLLAISGLHLSIIGMGGYKLLRKAGLGYGAAGLAGAVFIISYGMMTGGSPSAIRAAVMMSAGFLASYLGRTYDLISAASLALCLLVWESPDLLTQGGVQLSFGAVFAVGGVLPVIEAWLGSSFRIFGPLMVSAAIQLVTLPVILWNFFQFPVYGIFLNLLVIPLMGGVVCSGLGAAFLGGLPGISGSMAAGTGHYILQFYEWLCHRTEHLPWHTMVMGRPEAAAVVLYYGVLALMAAGMKRAVWKDKMEESKGKRGRNAGRSLPQGGMRAAVLVLACVLMPCILAPRPVKGLEAVFMDVGQGDGILLRSGRSAVLIDGGSTSEKKLGEYRLEPCLKSCGVSVIDYAFVSHGDQDHLSGVKYLLESGGEIQINNLILPYQGREDEVLTALAELAGERGTRVSYIEAGAEFTIGGMKVTCLYPGREDTVADKNDASEVLKVDYGNCRMLFTGDMSGDGERRLLSALEETPGVLAEIQILKAAHHGSRFSSEEVFLDALGVKWAVISYGAGNSYGHPHREVLDRFKERGVKLYETAEGGAIIMRTDGNRIKWKRYLD